MTLPGYLLVFGEPGAGVTEDEFRDWYDNEHVPLRVAIPAFQSWARWKAVDDQKPTWAATYDLTTYHDTLQPPYTTLAETRSDREKQVLKNVDTLERRTYEAYEGNDKYPKSALLFDPGDHNKFLQIVSADVKPELEEEFNKWYDEDHIPKIATIPGWVRSRRFVLKDWTRGGVEGSKDQTPVPKWLAVHEYVDLEWQKDPESKKMFDNEWTRRINAEVITKKEMRIVSFYRDWKRE
ncbi:hypothetical protein BDY19DRAFT_912317 [Irpex rosettiformis]|uniref:Uncharacterized protein n=1 Tax=Irpex rosettiformis TaxID=378272 RepID=A0ACB8UIT3_9APHY|nr:hypothetical protein BDY19DRAFT_912317 [Irpex rosettiformis]